MSRGGRDDCGWAGDRGVALEDHHRADRAAAALGVPDRHLPARERRVRPHRAGAAHADPGLGSRWALAAGGAGGDRDPDRHPGGVGLPGQQGPPRAVRLPLHPGRAGRLGTQDARPGPRRQADPRAVQPPSGTVGPYVSVVCESRTTPRTRSSPRWCRRWVPPPQLRAIRHAAYQASGCSGAWKRRRAPPGTAGARWNGSPTSPVAWDWSCRSVWRRRPTWGRSCHRCGRGASTTRCTTRWAWPGRRPRRSGCWPGPGAAISAELTAIESIERRADDNRRLRHAVAAGLESAVAVPASLILAFLSINATQVNRNLSMFSPHHLGMCLAVGAALIRNGGAAPARPTGSTRSSRAAVRRHRLRTCW